MAYANAEDVTVRLGSSADDTLVALINVRLGDAERMIRRRLKALGRDLDDEVDDPDGLDVEDVKQVEAEAVLRLARNPEGYQSETDGNYTYMLLTSVASGKLQILPEEWEILGVVDSAMSIIVPNAVRAT